MITRQTQAGISAIRNRMMLRLIQNMRQLLCIRVASGMHIRRVSKGVLTIKNTGLQIYTNALLVEKYFNLLHPVGLVSNERYN